MNIKPLERFATQARRDLLTAVDAQATAVLAPGSVARIERAGAVKKLEAEITAHGRTHVIDKVAYTWFNRIVALRFMDARSYTETGVVSPAKGQAHGQPEVLADAKRGNLNTDVVINKNTAGAIIGLLDGTRRSTDAEGEAYALLLTEYCRYWHKSMPFMFEREGDYTELLVPAGLLADGAILSQARMVLTDEVCDDVEVIGWLYQFYISERKQEIFDSKAKRGAAEIPAATQLFTPHWIVRYLVENSLGRVWMLNRPTSRLVDQMDYYIVPVDEETDFLKIAGPEELTLIDPACGSGHMLTYAFDLLYAIYEEEGYAPSDIPGLILTHNLYGTEIDPRAGALAAFALTMKARAKQRTFFNKQVEPNICVIERISFGPDELDFLVTRNCDRYEEEAFWNQFAEADTLGSLIQPDPGTTARLARYLESLDDGGSMLGARTNERANRCVVQAKYLANQYAVVVANPPYIGSANMGDTLASLMRDSFPQGKPDIYGGFMLRSRSLQLDLGVTAMVVGDSWLTIKTFEKIRDWVLNNYSISSLLHLQDNSKHSDIFGANAAFVLFGRGRGLDARRTKFIHLNALGSDKKESLLAAVLRGSETCNVSVVDAEDFRKLPLTAFAYSLPTHLSDLFAGLRVSSIAHVHRGISTGNNDRYMRLWFEVSRTAINPNATSVSDTANQRWYPVNRGSFPSRWYGYGPEVLDYRDGGRAMLAAAKSGTNPGFRHDGSAEYFKETITWSAMAAANPEFRLLPAGFVLGHKGAGIGVDSAVRLWLLGLLNSGPATEILRRISGTIDVLVGQIQELPLPQNSDIGRVDELVSSLVAYNQGIFAQEEGNFEFVRHPLLSEGVTDGSLGEKLTEWQRGQATLATRAHDYERELDRLFSDAYGLPWQDDRQPNFDLSGDRISQLVSFAVGCIFGRYSLDQPGLILADEGSTLKDYIVKVPSPTFMPDEDNVIPFVDDGWFGDDIVERFRQFLRAAFGTEHFEENLRFIEESLGVKTLRDYFITRAGKSKFYDDHVQRYKKRPIYWMFSSPRGSFNALIYIHRYNPSTVSTVLNEYLREYRAKLEVTLTNADQAAAAGSIKDQKEADRLRKVLAELRDYEHDVLYPLATQQLTIDLDDGVKVNYPKFYPALRKIVGLEVAE